MRGDRIKELRERAGLGRQKLAELLEVGEANIPRWENESNQPSADTLTKIAKFFGVSADYLLGLSDDPHGLYEDHLTPDEWALIARWRTGDVLGSIVMIASKG